MGSLSPGEMREIELTFPTKQLIAVKFDVSGEVDTNKLLQFKRITDLPGEIVSSLQQEFSDRLESIEINKFVSKGLETIDALNPNMTLSEVVQVRQTVGSRSKCSSEKPNSPGNLSNEFHLGRESTLGRHTRELVLMLVEFESKVSELDAAIGNTDLELIHRVVHDLK